MQQLIDISTAGQHDLVVGVVAHRKMEHSFARRQRQPFGILRGDQHRHHLDQFGLVLFLFDFLRDREDLDVLQDDLGEWLVARPSPWLATATRISTWACGRMKPEISLTSSTGTETARIPGGINSGITPAVFCPRNSLVATIGSLVTNWFFTNRAGDLAGIGEGAVRESRRRTIAPASIRPGRSCCPAANRLRPRRYTPFWPLLSGPRPPSF